MQALQSVHMETTLTPHYRTTLFNVCVKSRLGPFKAAPVVDQSALLTARYSGRFSMCSPMPYSPVELTKIILSLSSQAFSGAARGLWVRAHRANEGVPLTRREHSAALSLRHLSMASHTTAMPEADRDSQLPNPRCLATPGDLYHRTPHFADIAQSSWHQLAGRRILHLASVEPASLR